MSLVLGYADKSHAIIMSDGRAGGTISPSETYDKTRKINGNIILGFVGYKETSEHFIDCIYMELGERVNKCYIDEFLEIVKYGMNLDATKEKLQSTFMIIGREESGETFSVLAGNSTGYEIEKNRVTAPRILSIGGTVEGKIIEKIYTKNIRNKNISIEERMRKTIFEVSMVDNSVNSNTFIKRI